MYIFSFLIFHCQGGRQMKRANRKIVWIMSVIAIACSLVVGNAIYTMATGLRHTDLMMRIFQDQCMIAI